MGQLTYYILCGAVLVIGGSLLWNWMRPGPARIAAVLALALICGFASYRSDWIANLWPGVLSTPGEQARHQFNALLDDPNSELSEYLRVLIEIDPDARSRIEEIMVEAENQPDPTAYVLEEAMEYGLMLGATNFAERFSRVSDETAHEFAQFFSGVVSAVPDDDERCLKLLRLEDQAALLDLIKTMPRERLLATMAKILREGKSNPEAPPLTPADEQFLTDRMVAWVTSLSREDLAWLASLPQDGDEMAPFVAGPACRVFKSLFAYLAALPSPEGGRLLRLSIIMGMQPV